MNMTVALAGNPNSGKTTLFNALTGSNQYVGNWPGVTVERKEANLTILGDSVKLVDLPGVYSLSPYSIEENITRHFIAQHHPEVVLNIVDASNLERNLYLTLQLMELECPMVVALNMMDELERRGETIDCEQMSRELAVPVIPISAKKKYGFEALYQAIRDQAHHPRFPHPARKYEESTRNALREIVGALGGQKAHSAFDLAERGGYGNDRGKDDGHSVRAKHRHIGGYADEGDVDYAPPTMWVALKLLEGDELLKDSIQLSIEQWSRIRKSTERYVRRGQETYPGIDALTLVVDARYRRIGEILERSGYRRRNREESVSDRIDRIVTHKIFAFPIFFMALALMFYITFGPFGSWLTGLTEGLVGKIGVAAEALLVMVQADIWVHSLVLEGVIAGVGGVLVFLPQILLIFLFMAILEDSGYMSRAAFITDRLLRNFGLSGRSFIPMLMGFGCTTTAIVAARGVENERDRRMTILLTPFMSCGARLPVYGLFTAAFFPGNKALVVMSLYGLGMLMMVICGLILRKTAFKEGDSPFLMELPPYRMPNVKSVAIRLWDRVRDFLSRAGTLIFAMTVVVWFMESFSPALQYVENSELSIFGRVGSLIAPLFAPLGFGQWEKGVALLSGLVAKEAVVSTLQVLYSAGTVAELSGVISGQFTQLSAYSFLVFILLYAPCVAAMAAARRELQSRKYFLLSLAIQMGTAYGVSLLVYQVGRLIIG